MTTMYQVHFGHRPVQSRMPSSGEVLLAAREAFEFMTASPTQEVPSTSAVRAYLLSRKHDPIAVTRAMRQLAVLSTIRS